MIFEVILIMFLTLGLAMVLVLQVPISSVSFLTGIDFTGTLNGAINEWGRPILHVMLHNLTNAAALALAVTVIYAGVIAAVAIVMRVVVTVRSWLP